MLEKFMLIFTIIIQSVFTQCPSYAPIDIALSMPPYGLPGPGLAGPILPTPGLIPPGIAAPGFPGPGLGNPYNLPLQYGLNVGLNGLPMGVPGIFYENIEAPIEYTATASGALPVNSASNVSPTGVSVLSENVYEGTLGVAGDLPFLGTVAVDGVMPSAGIRAVNYGCGNGLNAMTAISEYSTPATAVMPGPVPIMPNPYTTSYNMATQTCASSPPAYTVASPTCSSPAPIYNPPFITPFSELANTVPCNIAINGIEFTATTGGAFPVFSSSTTGPVGLTVTADIGYEGALTVAGAMPFVGTAAVDGALPVVGLGAVNHACGSGRNAMVSQGNGSPSEPVASVSASCGPCL